MKTLILLLPLTLLLGSCSLLVDFKEEKSVKEKICNDQLDNDGDGNIDCVDQDCYESPDCVTTNNVSNLNNVANGEICNNFVDDDDDGATDCDDSDCSTDPNCSQLREICGNGTDDDDDGAVDCEDPDCVGDESCPNIEGETDCGDGLDRDANGLTDGLIDCLDPDCTDNPICRDRLLRCFDTTDYDNGRVTVFYYTDIYQSAESEDCGFETLCGIRPEISWVPFCYPEPDNFSTSYNPCDQQMPCGPGMVCAHSDKLSEEVNSDVCLPLCAPGYLNTCIGGNLNAFCHQHLNTAYNVWAGETVELWLCDEPLCNPMAPMSTNNCDGPTSQCIPATDLMGAASCHPSLGTTPIGTLCTTDNDCIPGSVCRAGENDQDPVCHKLCLESTTCSRGNTCFRADNRQRFGFCQ